MCHFSVRRKRMLGNGATQNLFQIFRNYNARLQETAQKHTMRSEYETKRYTIHVQLHKYTLTRSV